MIVLSLSAWLVDYLASTPIWHYSQLTKYTISNVTHFYFSFISKSVLKPAFFRCWNVSASAASSWLCYQRHCAIGPELCMSICHHAYIKDSFIFCEKQRHFPSVWLPFNNLIIYIQSHKHLNNFLPPRSEYTTTQPTSNIQRYSWVTMATDFPSLWIKKGIKNLNKDTFRGNPGGCLVFAVVNSWWEVSHCKDLFVINPYNCQPPPPSSYPHPASLFHDLFDLQPARHLSTYMAPHQLHIKKYKFLIHGRRNLPLC